jgi:phosphopantothenoylcysteine decarboxylase
VSQLQSGFRVLLGVTGGIAVYKAAALTSQLVQNGYQVQVILTPSAQTFVGEATFAALSGMPVVKDLFDPAYPLGAHIELARQADLLCVAPATANFLGKAAHALADDLLSTLYLCFTRRVLLAPAMNREMWDKPAVQRNIQQLEQDGVQFVGPNAGWLSCRDQGVGRMAEAGEIFAAIEAMRNETGTEH